MIGIVVNAGKWVSEDGIAFVEGNAMLEKICPGFLRIPLELHDRSLRHAGRRGNERCCTAKGDPCGSPSQSGSCCCRTPRTLRRGRGAVSWSGRGGGACGALSTRSGGSARG